MSIKVQECCQFKIFGIYMASANVAGIVALMAQKDPILTATQAEFLLKSTAIPIEAGCRNIVSPSGPTQVCWGAGATGAGLVLADAALAATP